MDPINNDYRIDGDFLRGVTVSVINLLNKSIYYPQIQTDGSFKDVHVPFYYSLSQDGRFLQDHYINFDECESPYADGNYDVVPRGIVVPSNWTVQMSASTSNYSRINYIKNVEGELKSHSAYAKVIPFLLSYDIYVVADTLNQANMIWQRMICVLMYTTPFMFRWNTIPIPSRIGFPSGGTFELPKEWQYPQGRELFRVNFPAEIETYMPCIDYASEFFNGNTMQTFMNSAGIQGPNYGDEDFNITHWKNWSNIPIEEIGMINPKLYIDSSSAAIERDTSQFEIKTQI